MVLDEAVALCLEYGNPQSIRMRSGHPDGLPRIRRRQEEQRCHQQVFAVCMQASQRLKKPGADSRLRPYDSVLRGYQLSLFRHTHQLYINGKVAWRQVSVVSTVSTDVDVFYVVGP